MPEEFAEIACISIHEVWRRLENGSLPAVVLADFKYNSHDNNFFDYTLIPPEAVRRIVAGYDVELKTDFKNAHIDGKKELIRVLVSPESTPEIYATDNDDNKDEKPVPWWQTDYDILELAQQYGEKLSANGKVYSLNNVAKAIVTHINEKERRNTKPGQNARTISTTSLKKGPLKGWKFTTEK